MFPWDLCHYTVKGPLGVLPSLQAIVSGSWVVGLGSQCSIERGCKPELSPSKLCNLVFSRISAEMEKTRSSACFLA